MVSNLKRFAILVLCQKRLVLGFWVLQIGVIVVVQPLAQMLNTGIIIGYINRFPFHSVQYEMHRSSYSSIKPFCLSGSLFANAQSISNAKYQLQLSSGRICANLPKIYGEFRLYISIINKDENVQTEKLSKPGKSEWHGSGELGELMKRIGRRWHLV